MEWPAVVIYGVVVRYRSNDVVLDEGQVAAAIKGTVGWQEWTMAWQEKRAIDSDIRDDFPGDESVILTVDTGLYEDEDAQLLANFLLKNLGGLREGFKVTLLAVGLETTIGQTETLSVELQNGAVVMGLDGSNRYAIISTEDNPDQDEVVNEVWR